MRRKVIQDFANVFCQRFIDLPSGYDVATCAYLGSGTLILNILTGECTHDGAVIPKLKTCDEYKAWLEKQRDKHHIPPEGIEHAVMTITFSVTDVVVRESYGHVFRSARFTFDCRSEIRTDVKAYTAHSAGEKRWGFDYYWEKLYGQTEL